jgi:hypothetical protein
MDGKEHLQVFVSLKSVLRDQPVDEGEEAGSCITYRSLLRGSLVPETSSRSHFLEANRLCQLAPKRGPQAVSSTVLELRPIETKQPQAALNLLPPHSG